MVAAFGFPVSIVAIVGTQFFGWEWGDGQLIPTILGIIVAAIAVLVVVRRALVDQRMTFHQPLGSNWIHGCNVPRIPISER